MNAKTYPTETSMYPDDIQLSQTSTDERYGQMITYFNTNTGQMASRKCLKDHEADQRMVDAALLKHMAGTYYSIARRSIWLPQNINNAFFSLDSLKECVKALDVVDIYNITLVSNAITKILDEIGEHNMINPPPGTKRLCGQLRWIAEQAQRRYEKVLYHD